LFVMCVGFFLILRSDRFAGAGEEPCGRGERGKNHKRREAAGVFRELAFSGIERSAAV